MPYTPGCIKLMFSLFVRVGGCGGAGPPGRDQKEESHVPLCAGVVLSWVVLSIEHSNEKGSTGASGHCFLNQGYT